MPRGMSIAHADRLYESAATVRYDRFPVRNDMFEAFSFARSRLFTRLGEASQDPYWREFSRWTYRFWRWGMSVPIPFSHPRMFSDADAVHYRTHLIDCDQMYPGTQQMALTLVDLMERLASVGGAPLLEPLRTLLLRPTTDGPTALVVRETALFDAVTETLDRAGLSGKAELVSAYHLRGKPYGRLVLIGSSRWFPEYVFASPRAREIHMIHYNWVNGDPKVEPLFVSSTWSKKRSYSALHVARPDDLDAATAAALAFDVGRYLGRVRAAEQAQDEFLEADARLFLLEEGTGAFLDTDSSALVLETDGVGGKSLDRRFVGEIEPGMFLLLRQGGGGDYIVPIADSLLGDEAAEVRLVQRQWKARLRRLVQTQGIHQVGGWLKAHGAKRASDANIRNWMSDGSIKTSDYRDFAAIMSAIGMKNEAKAYWSAMSRIETAHIKAGKVIRQQLLKQVSGASAQELERVGRMDFWLDAAIGVTMTAQRIVRVDPGPYRVPHSRLNRLFELEG